MINELRTFQLAYEANMRHFQKNPGARSLSTNLNALEKNKKDYFTCRNKLIEQSIDVSNFPEELNYMEIKN